MPLDDKLPLEDVPEALATEFLPASLQKESMVFSTSVFQWLAANFLIIGIGIGMLASFLIARFLEPGYTMYGFPVAMVVAAAIAKTVIAPREREFGKKAREALSAAQQNQ